MPSTRKYTRKPIVTSVAVEENCSICMESLASKRSVSLHPCNHRFHRTCILNWFESGKCMMPADFTCCLCRTKCEKTTDEKEEIMPRFFPFEKKPGMETFIRMLPNYEDHHVKMHCEISNAINALHEEKNLAMSKKKSKEFVADLNEEIEKLTDRSRAVEDIIVNLAVEKKADYLKLDEELFRLENELENSENAGKRDELEGIRKKMNAIEEEVRGSFREKCSRMAATSTSAAETTESASTVPSNRVIAKRRMNSNEKSRVQPKRRRH